MQEISSYNFHKLKQEEFVIINRVTRTLNIFIQKIKIVVQNDCIKGRILS